MAELTLNHRQWLLLRRGFFEATVVDFCAAAFEEYCHQIEAGEYDAIIAHADEGETFELGIRLSFVLHDFWPPRH